jgi:hypothetical protein
MRTGVKFASFIMVGVVCMGGLSIANASSRNQHKAKAKKVTLPPLPSGPLGPVPQLPLDSTPAVAPQVSYQSGQLTILAPNSNLGDILRAVRKQTGAEMEIPANANERVVTQLGPAPAREVIAELLNGSRFNYVLLGSPADANALTRVVLVAKTGGEVPGQNPQQASDQTGIVAEPQPDMANAQPEPPEGEAADENAAEDNPDQNAEAEQPAPPPDQPGVKTPQQMLQEMQQRQLQLQQQQPQGQPPIPGAGYPPPPQRPPEQQ